MSAVIPLHFNHLYGCAGFVVQVASPLPQVSAGEGSTVSSIHTESAVHEPRLGRNVSIDQAAQLLNVSRRTIYNRIRDGRLHTIRTIGGSQRVLVESLHDLGFRPQAYSTSASAASFDVRPVTR